MIAFLVSRASAWASSPVTVAVLPLTNLTGDTNETHWRYTVPFLLKAQLREAKAIRVKPDQFIEFQPDISFAFATDELGLDFHSPLTLEEVRSVGETIESAIVVSGDYQRAGKGWKLSLQAVRTSTRQISPVWTVSAAQWWEAISEIRGKLLEFLGAKISPKEFVRMNQPPTHSPEALNFLSRAYAQRIEAEQSSLVLEKLRQAVALDPDFTIAQLALANVLVMESKTELAAKHARLAIKSRPDCAATHYALGLAYSFENRVRQAEEELREAAQFDANEPYVQLRLGELWGGQGDWKRSIGALIKAEGLLPYDAKIHAVLGRIYAQAGNTNAALDQLLLAERFDRGGDVGLYVALAEAYMALDEMAPAIKNYEKFLAGVQLLAVDGWLVQKQKNALADAKRRLTIHFVAPPTVPKIDREELNKILQTKLTPNEFRRVKYPLAVTPKMRNWVEQTVGSGGDPMEKAQRLESALSQGGSLRRELSIRHLENCRTAEEAFSLWSASKNTLICQDYAILYVALARELGLDSHYVLVNKDQRGRLTGHACAGVVIGQKAILVDPAYSWFGVNHQDYEFLDDVQMMASYLSQSGNLVMCEAAAKLAPEIALIHFMEAAVLASDGKTAEARKALTAGLDKGTQLWAGYYTEGFLAWSEGDMGGAARSLVKCINLNPDYASAHYQLGEVLDKQGKLEEAREEFRAYLGGEGLTKEETSRARKAIAKIDNALGE